MNSGTQFDRQLNTMAEDILVRWHDMVTWHLYADVNLEILDWDADLFRDLTLGCGEA